MLVVERDFSIFTSNRDVGMAVCSRTKRVFARRDVWLGFVKRDARSSFLDGFVVLFMLAPLLRRHKTHPKSAVHPRETGRPTVSPKLSLLDDSTCTPVDDEDDEDDDSSSKEPVDESGSSSIPVDESPVDISGSGTTPVDDDSGSWNSLPVDDDEDTDGSVCFV